MAFLIDFAHTDDSISKWQLFLNLMEPDRKQKQEQVLIFECKYANKTSVAADQIQDMFLNLIDSMPDINFSIRIPNEEGSQPLQCD